MKTTTKYYQLESNIPMNVKPRTVWGPLFTAAKKGQSFLIPRKVRGRIHAVAATYGVKVKTRQLGSDYRVWIISNTSAVE